MAGTLEIWDSRGRTYFNLEGDRVIVGSAEDTDLVIDDPTVSRVHARLERVGNIWMLTDLGATNGTLLRGRRIMAPERLSHDDDIVMGRTKLVFLDKASDRRPRTLPLEEVPTLTRTEKSVLVELCRPLLSGNPFNPPAPVKQIAQRRNVGRGAIEAVLLNLYDKFGIHKHPDDEIDRRTRLANEAVQRGVIGPNDLKEP
jgi:pSer/pThr/pTyr-binding forkhead associated (FHA) protein